MGHPSARMWASTARVRAAIFDRLTWRVQEESMSPRFALWIALLVFAVLLLLTEELSRYRASEVASERKAATLAFASELRARGDRELNSVPYLASGVVGYLVVRHEQLDPDEVSRILAAVHSSSQHIRNFSIAIGYRVGYVFPLTGNEAIVGLDYRDLPEQWPAVKLVVDNRQHVLTGPVDLVQGGRGLIYRMLVFIDGHYWGMLATVIDLRSLRKGAFGGLDGARYDFAVVEGANATLLRPLLARLRPRIATPVTVGNLALNVSASIGCACFPDEASNAAQLLELADQRMYQEKAGRAAG